MIGAFLSNGAALSRLLFAALALASAGRFGAAGFRVALNAATPTPAPTRTEPRLPRPVRSERPPSPPEPSASAAATEVGQPVILTLAITAGPPRSEVYVNGRHVGDSPFFGDISCKSGQPLKVEIVPRKGELISVERRCRTGMMRLSEAILNDPYRQP